MKKIILLGFLISIAAFGCKTDDGLTDLDSPSNLLFKNSIISQLSGEVDGHFIISHGYVPGILGIQNARSEMGISGYICSDRNTCDHYILKGNLTVKGEIVPTLNVNDDTNFPMYESLNSTLCRNMFTDGGEIVLYKPNSTELYFSTNFDPIDTLIVDDWDAPIPAGFYIPVVNPQDVALNWNASTLGTTLLVSIEQRVTTASGQTEMYTDYYFAQDDGQENFSSKIRDNSKLVNITLYRGDVRVVSTDDDKKYRVMHCSTTSRTFIISN